MSVAAVRAPSRWSQIAMQTRPKATSTMPPSGRDPDATATPKPAMSPAAPRAVLSGSVTSRMPLPAKALRIGRIPDNELVLSDLDVSRHHAELRKSPSGTYEIVDLGSHNGTFVNGRRVSSAALSKTDIVSIGRSTFRLAGGELRQFVDDGEVTFTAQDLVVKVGGGKILLNHVTFPIPEKSLVGVIGPSGAGKSGLAGLVWKNRISLQGHCKFNFDLVAPPTPIALELPRRTCVPVGRRGICRHPRVS